jgi:hypothetical protein
VLGGGAGLPAPLGLKQDGDVPVAGGKAIPGPKGATGGSREGLVGGNGGSWGAPGGANADAPPGLQQQQSWSFPPNGGDGTGSGAGSPFTAPQTPPDTRGPGSSKFPLPVPGRGQQGTARAGTLGSPNTQPGAGGSFVGRVNLARRQGLARASDVPQEREREPLALVRN